MGYTDFVLGARKTFLCLVGVLEGAAFVPAPSTWPDGLRPFG